MSGQFWLANFGYFFVMFLVTVFAVVSGYVIISGDREDARKRKLALIEKEKQERRIIIP